MAKTKKSSANVRGESTVISAVPDTSKRSKKRRHERTSADVQAQYSAGASQGSTKQAKSQGKRSIARRVAFVILLVLLAAIIAFAGWVVNYATELGSQFGLANSELSQDEQLEITETLAEASDDLTEPFYIMLIGSDQRSWEAAGTGRSDTAIIMRVDASTYTISMLSIPRDTRVYIPGYWTTKFNAAYVYGGAALTIRTATEITGIEIQHYAEIDFTGLEELVDAIGGIDMYVPVEVTDEMAGTTAIPQGWSHLDGEQTLMLARSRDWVGSDFTRQAFQREIIEAIIEQVLSLSLTELTSVVNLAAENVTTDLELTEIIQLALLFMDADEITFYSANLPSTTATIDDVSYVLLVEEDVDSMVELFMAGEDPNDYEATQWAYTGSMVDMGDDEEEDTDSDSSE